MGDNEFEIEGGNRKVIVEGSLVDDGEINIYINGNRTIIRSSMGKFELEDNKASLVSPNGIYVEEKGSAIEISLPDGTKIYKDPLRKWVVFRDGSRIEEKVDGVPDKSEMYEILKPSLIQIFFFTFGVLSPSPFLILMAIAFYVGESGWELREYGKRLLYNYRDTDEKVGSELDNIKQQYRDGEISENEFERKLDNYFSEKSSSTVTDDKSERYQFEKERN